MGGSFGTTVFNEGLVGFLPEDGLENNNALVVSFFWAHPLVCALGFHSFSLSSWLSLLLREMQKVAEMDRPETRHFVQKCVSQFLPINNLWTGLLALAGLFCAALPIPRSSYSDKVTPFKTCHKVLKVWAALKRLIQEVERPLRIGIAKF